MQDHARVEDGEECVMPQRIAAPETMALAAIDAEIRRAKTAPSIEPPMPVPSTMTSYLLSLCCI